MLPGPDREEAEMLTYLSQFLGPSHCFTSRKRTQEVWEINGILFGKNDSDVTVTFSFLDPLLPSLNILSLPSLI